MVVRMMPRSERWLRFKVGRWRLMMAILRKMIQLEILIILGIRIEMADKDQVEWMDKDRDLIPLFKSKKICSPSVTTN